MDRQFRPAHNQLALDIWRRGPPASANNALSKEAYPRGAAPSTATADDEAVNVLIFVILLPLGLIGLIARTVWLERRLSAQGKARQLTLPAVHIVFWSTVLLFILALGATG